MNIKYSDQDLIENVKSVVYKNSDEYPFFDSSSPSCVWFFASSVNGIAFFDRNIFGAIIAGIKSGIYKIFPYALNEVGANEASDLFKKAIAVVEECIKEFPGLDENSMIREINNNPAFRNHAIEIQEKYVDSHIHWDTFDKTELFLTEKLPQMEAEWAEVKKGRKGPDEHQG